MSEHLIITRYPLGLAAWEWVAIIVTAAVLAIVAIVAWARR